MTEWMPVPGYEGRYEISDTGVVFSHLTNKVLAQSTNRYGYLRVTLLDAHGNLKTWTIHQLVVLAFRGPRPADKSLVRHLDDDKANNALSNLAYGTKRENALDSVKHGTHRGASATHCHRGHGFDDVNTYRGGGRRQCRSCNREAVRRYAARQKVAS